MRFWGIFEQKPLAARAVMQLANRQNGISCSLQK
jgi:hypothetical protein